MPDPFQEAIEVLRKAELALKVGLGDGLHLGGHQLEVVESFLSYMATETRLRSARRLSSQYSSAGRVMDSRIVEGSLPVFLGWADMVTPYNTTVVYGPKEGG